MNNRHFRCVVCSWLRLPASVLLLSIFSISCILLAGAAALLLGEYSISATELTAFWFAAETHSTQPLDSNQEFVLMELRLPRYVLAILTGASLAVAGVIVQSITRNPLGSPSLMGVSSGAAFAIVLAMVMFDLTTVQRLWLGTVGGMAAASLTFAIAWKSALSPLFLTLAGMCVSLFFTAAITLLLVSADSETQGIYYWLVGGLANRTWLHAELLLPFALIGLAVGLLLARPLNILMLEQQIAESVGLAVRPWRLLLGAVAVMLTAATVAVAGPIAFVGLIAPHIVRFVIGPTAAAQHGILLPLAALVGAALLTTADLFAKYHEIPVGILSVLVGGPLFVLLIARQKL